MRIFEKNSSHGFTLPELLIGMGMFAILVGLVTVNLTHTQSSANINSTIDTFIADLKQQQVKAMVGDTEGGTSPSSYGVHIDPTDYVLFKGSNYSSTDPTNLTIQMQGVTFTGTSFANDQLVFDQVDGKISGLTGEGTITLQTPTGQQKTITLNTYGAVVSVQ